MEHLAAIIRRMVLKHDEISDSTDKALSELLSLLKESKRSVEGAYDPQWQQELLKRMKKGEFTQRIKDASYAGYNAVSRLGKKIDEVAHDDISAACRRVEMDTETLNRVVTEHLCREGHFELGAHLAKEASVRGFEDMMRPYEEMHRVLLELKRRNVMPALAWAEQNKSRLGCERHVEFMLHRLCFLDVLEREGQSAAILYGRKHFAPFMLRHLDDIQQLMGLTLWAGRLEKAPRRELLSESLWEAAAEEVARQSCALLGQASESPLLVAVAAGSTVLPALLKISKMMGANAEFKSCEQLPVELELGREYYFHSIFSCPVSKDQSTRDNPPMMLPCGHVLNRESIESICKKDAVRLFKCPYCPHETRYRDCRPVIFPSVEAEQLLQMRNHLNLGDQGFSARGRRAGAGSLDVDGVMS